MVQNRQKVKVNPSTFERNLAIFRTFFKVHFLEKYTSNEAQTKLKTLLKGLKKLFGAFLNNFKNGQKSSKS